jgi:hypothetical protein
MNVCNFSSIWLGRCQGKIASINVQLIVIIDPIHFFLISVIGVFLFFIEVIILCWVKFWEMGLPEGEPGKLAARVSTIVFCPFLVAFISFAIYFYSKLADHKYESSTLQIKELEQMLETIEETNNKMTTLSPIKIHVAEKKHSQRFACKPQKSGSFYINLSPRTKNNCYHKQASTSSNAGYQNSAFHTND